VGALALPPWGWWFLAPAAMAVLYVLGEGVDRWRGRFVRAWVFVGAGYLVGLLWMADITIPGYLVSVPILGALMAAPLSLVPPTGPWRPAAFPAAWIVAESVRMAFPFGGMPMSSVALGQVDAPWVDAARVSGLLLVVGVTALVAVAGVEAARRRWVVAVAAGAVVVLASVLGAAAPDGRATDEIVAAAVQGGGRLGTRAADSDSDEVWRRHVQVTETLDPSVELVVWPETVEDVARPAESSDRVTELARLASELEAVMVVGFNELEPGIRRNIVLAVAPGGDVTGRYDKVHLVPFGEYVPLRWLIDPFAELSLIGTEITAGTGENLIPTPVSTLTAPVSYEVYFPDRVREGVLAGAGLVVNPTLASSYRTTHVPEQTLAAGRLRAIETGRWVVQSSTTGYSSIIDHRGRVVDRTGLREQGAVTATAQIRSGHTWAVGLGQIPITVAATAVLVGAAAHHAWKRRRHAGAGVDPSGPAVTATAVNSPATG
jgi:apolipoprotein N-acyltransferase